MAGYTDWQEPMGVVFTATPIDNVVELGLGEGTAWLLDRAKHVLSIEFLARRGQQFWVDATKDKYKNYSNWECQIIKTEDAYTPVVIDTINNLEKADLVFVDPGIHCRGKIVEQLMNNDFPLVAAHDTSVGHEVYGWKEIVVPAGYYVIQHKPGQGTTFWTNQEGLSRALPVNLVS